MATVTMVLALGPGRPEGDLEDRMVLQVELTAPGYLDAAAWEEGTTPWRTVRTRAGQVTRSGELVKIAEGWALRELGSEDEPLYSFRPGIIRPGEVVSVSRLDGDEMIYRIVAVE
jgi:hypothetical protein